jgi:hypothetical protein
MFLSYLPLLPVRWPAPPVDSDRTTQLASPFNQWAPVPLAAAARPGEGEPTATHQRAGSMWTFTGHGPIIPEVAFLIQPTPTKRSWLIANPRFRGWIPRFAGSSQPSFCVYTLLRISDPDELSFPPEVSGLFT